MFGLYLYLNLYSCVRDSLTVLIIEVIFVYLDEFD